MSTVGQYSNWRQQAFVKHNNQMFAFFVDLEYNLNNFQKSMNYI